MQGIDQTLKTNKVADHSEDAEEPQILLYISDMIICDKYSILIILKMRRNLITRTVLTIWLAWDGLFNH